MKVAIVYDRLNKWGGAERVLLAFAKLFPDAHWYTSFWDQQKTPFTKNWQVTASYLNKFRFLRDKHAFFAYLMPFIFESFDFSQYDLVISISSEFAKGIITKPGTIHINYCLTPTRYLWSHRHEYYYSEQFGLLQKILRPIGKLLLDALSHWDLVAATRPDEMIAISTCVKKRIKDYYQLDSRVIYPPVDLSLFNTPSTYKPDLPKGYYLVVSRLEPYKNIEKIVDCFKSLPSERLVIIGIGSQLSKLKGKKPKNVTFLGLVEEAKLVSYYMRAKAFIQANVEDFGLAMVEAQAAGLPVIANRGGGALDIIKKTHTGILYDGTSEDGLLKAIKSFNATSYSPKLCKQNAARFDIYKWEKQIKERVKSLCH